MASKKLSLAELKGRHYKFETSSNSSSNWPKLRLPEFAFIGRSNVGKSTLINSLTMQHNLAKTSKTPGRTQMLNCFTFKESFRLVDLPGYGFAKTPKAVRAKWKDFTLEYILERDLLQILFILIDSRHGMKAIDFDMINLCATNDINYRIIMTKLDKTKKADFTEKEKLILHNLKTELSYEHDIILTSSLKNIGFDDIRTAIINNL
ncbi:MAG: ribosome biogenesis GTP-binding protein YsxC [Rickettsiales bacterium]|jgi:GTP-binding protein|nr:ribosome biogenesis GTP-binding protein YsxC [Rickettsiales bacterium]